MATAEKPIAFLYIDYIISLSSKTLLQLCDQSLGKLKTRLELNMEKKRRG